MHNQLSIIVQESGLEPTKAQYILDNFQSYFAIAADWEKKARAIVVTDAMQRAEMKMAREARLFLREKRMDVERARKNLKEQSLREGKAIDGIANILKALIEPIEQYLDQQEHFVEIRAEAEAARLRAEDAARVELQRLADAKAAEDERLRMVAENAKLKAEAEAREKAMQAERAKAQKEREALEAKARAEAEAREKLEQEKKQKEEQEKARIKAEADAIKLANKAPDIEKLRAYAVELATVAVPKVKTEEAQATLDQALVHLKKAVQSLTV